MSLVTWVSDSLHDILGYSDNSVAEYLIAVAKKNPKVNAVLASFKNNDIPVTAATRRFAKQLVEKVPKKKITTNQVSQRKQLDILRKNESFQLLEDSDGDEKLEIHVKKKKKKKKKKRKRSSSSEDEDAPTPTRVKQETAEEKEARHIMEREQDIKERDAFAERRLKAEKDKTRRLVGGTDKTKTITEEDFQELLPKLRETSRQAYLQKREGMKLEELRRIVADEEFLWGNGTQLSKEEKTRHLLNKELLRLAEERLAVRNAGDVDGYMLPESRPEGKDFETARMDVLTKRYQEEVKITNDFEMWEEQNTGFAINKFGAQDKKSDEPAYDFVFEDQVDFIEADISAGKDPEKEAEVYDEDEGDTEHEKLLKVRRTLPIFPYRDQLLQAVEDHQTLIIVGETGSGKTTQITQYLYEAGYGNDGFKIGCTQPRRVAAMSVAARVAQEMDVKLGHECGYSIRFEDCTSDRTVIKYMTDGMLLREFLGEPDLKNYKALMIDEAHERTLHTDILFGLVKDIARFRPDLKLLISSATLDAQKFAEYFDDAPIFRIPGRMYPVTVYYTKSPEADYVDAAVVSCLQIHLTQPKGDILVFFSGQEEIETAEEVLSIRMRRLGDKVGELLVRPIYSTLPSDQQALIFEPTPPGARKVVLATNIAETSLTINGIIYVIDPGFCKQTSYDPRTGMESLIVTPVSRASAEQRMGRAGRVSAGKCFRLYTAHAFANEMEENTIPEIQRTNLGNVVLMLKSLGINDLIHFDFMDPPPAETLIRALEQLYALGALNDLGELTKMGRRMAELPMDPMLSKMLIKSEQFNCSSEILTICAMLSASAAIFFRPKDKKVHADNAHKNFWHPRGDHLTLLNCYSEWVDSDYSADWCAENFIQIRSMRRARDVRDQLVDMADRVELTIVEGGDDIQIRKAIASGFFYHTAKLGKSGAYKTVKHNQTIMMHPSSCLFKELPPWIVYHELVLTTKEFTRQNIIIEPRWLVEIAPHYYKKKDIEEHLRKMPKGKGANTSKNVR